MPWKAGPPPPSQKQSSSWWSFWCFLSNFKFFVWLEMASISHSYKKVPVEEDNAWELEQGETLNPERKFWPRRKASYIAFHLILLCLYIIVSFTVVNRVLKAHAQQQRLPTLTYSITIALWPETVEDRLIRGNAGPAREAVRDTTYVFNAAPNLTSPYVGESRPSLDRAWHDLLRSARSALPTTSSTVPLIISRHQHENLRARSKSR